MANVLSIKEIKLCALDKSAISLILIIFKRGFDGVSMYIALVFFLIFSSKNFTSIPSVKEYSIPYLLNCAESGGPAGV